MSADTYLLIRKEDCNWVAYMEFASMEEPSYSSEKFVASSLEDAIILAQGVYTEYGYKFEVDKLYEESSTSNKKYFPRTCKYCGGVQSKPSKGINMDGLHGVDFLNYDDYTS